MSDMHLLKNNFGKLSIPTFLDPLQFVLLRVNGPLDLRSLKTSTHVAPTRLPLQAWEGPTRFPVTELWQVFELQTNNTFLQFEADKVFVVCRLWFITDSVDPWRNENQNPTGNFGHLRGGSTSVRDPKATSHAVKNNLRLV